jgi:ATP-binding cassette subfamily B protein
MRNLIRQKISTFAKQLRYLPRAVRLVWPAAARWMLPWIALIGLQAVLPAATAYITRSLVDSLVSLQRGGPAAAGMALRMAGWICGILLAAELLRSASAWIRTAQAESIQDYLSGLIHRKSAAVDLAFYDSADYYDHLHRARTEATYRPAALLETLGSILQNSITLIAMLIVLSQFGPWIPLALAASTVPAAYVVLQNGLYQYSWRLRATERERRSWYYDWLLTTGATAAELRLFDLGGYFYQQYQSLRASLRAERIGMAKRQAYGSLAAGAAGLAIASAVLISVVLSAARGRTTLGNLALFYFAFQQGLGLMRSLLENVGELYRNSLFVHDLFEFLELESSVCEPAAPAPAPAVKQAIRLIDVDFRYPGSTRVSLRNFNLTIPAGQVVALVGPNGAGKSTLIKLLCRFYDPERGRIEVDGVDIRQLSIAELRGMITVLFQEPVHYNDTASDNVAMGAREQSADQPAIRSAATAAGADPLIRKLPDGYDTLLGKWFKGGVELSVGEWQRIALARAFLRQSPILILDEPTSAMDPWAESDWLARFRTLATERTAILITHRFTTAMHADMIHVITEGQVVESGSHSELLAHGGLYAQSWTAQMHESLP